MVNLTVVGMPITVDSVTQEFLDFVNNQKDCLIFTSGSYDVSSLYENNDYITSKLGHDILFSSGKKVISLNLWYNKDKRKTPKIVLNELYKIIKKTNSKYPNKEYYYIVPGSPFYGDSISPKLIKEFNANVIDTKSSKTLTEQLFPNKKIKVFECLGPAYNKRWYKNILLFINLLYYDEVYSVSLGEINKVIPITKKQFIMMMKNKTTNMNSLTFAYVRN